MDEEDYNYNNHYMDNKELRSFTYYFGIIPDDHTQVAEALVARWCGLDEMDSRKPVVVIYE